MIFNFHIVSLGWNMLNYVFNLLSFKAAITSNVIDTERNLFHQLQILFSYFQSVSLGSIMWNYVFIIKFQSGKDWEIYFTWHWHWQNSFFIKYKSYFVIQKPKTRGRRLFDFKKDVGVWGEYPPIRWQVKSNETKSRKNFLLLH